MRLRLCRAQPSNIVASDSLHWRCAVGWMSQHHCHQRSIVAAIVWRAAVAAAHVAVVYNNTSRTDSDSVGSFHHSFIPSSHRSPGRLAALLLSCSAGLHIAPGGG